MSEVARRAALARQPLFPEQNGATDIRVIYVQQPGGPVVRPMSESYSKAIEVPTPPCLHVSFTSGGLRRTTLLPLSMLERRGMPTDYETLSAMFPQLEWSAR